MKFYLAFVVAVIGVGMVAADENLKSKLQMALKSMLNENEELQMQSRDSIRQCRQDTNNCNNHGTCTRGINLTYYCMCDMPYLVGGSDSSCYDPSPEATKDLELEMLTRDSLGRCNADTHYCDGAGECVTKANARYVGEYICVCDGGYRNNAKGGCSRMTTREIEYLDMLARDEQMEMLVRKYVSISQCRQQTNDCNEGGECVEEDGKYWCKCGEDYEENEDGGCSPIVTRATEVDDDDFAERKKEIMRQLAEFLQEV